MEVPPCPPQTVHTIHCDSVNRSGPLQSPRYLTAVPTHTACALAFLQGPEVLPHSCTSFVILPSAPGLFSQLPPFGGEGLKFAPSPATS